MTSPGATTYTSDFYTEQGPGSGSSAQAVVPHLLEIFAPRSVVDVGCGLGGWLAQFAEHGVDDVLGIDGAWVDQSQLEISSNRFMALDLTQATQLDRTFDMCLCLEVAEHLYDVHAPRLVDFLTSLAPVIAFSAAIPGQTGEHHVNERWQSYWAAMFRDRGFASVDCIRPLIWERADSQWWYAQNLLVYVKNDTLARRADLSALAARTQDSMIDLVHPNLWAMGAAAMEAQGAGFAARVRRLRHRIRARARKP